MPDVSKLKVRSTIYDIKDEGARQTKLDKNLGVAYAGKFLKVNDSGEITPSAGGTSQAVWGGIVGTLSNQTDLLLALNSKQSLLVFDNVPTAGSSNPVKSNGIKTEIDKKLNKSFPTSPDKYLITNSDGDVVTGNLPVATTTQLGIVKPDGITITINADGKLVSVGSGSAAWGSISGDITNQTDLMDELNTLSTQISSCVSNAGDRHITLEWKDDGWLYARTESS